MPIQFPTGPPPNELLIALADYAPYAWFASMVAGTATACCDPKRRSSIAFLITLTVVTASPAVFVCGLHTLGVLMGAGSLDIYFLMNVALPSIPLSLAAIGVWRMVRRLHENAA